MTELTQSVKLIDYCSYNCKYPDAIARSIGLKKLCRSITTSDTKSDGDEDAWIVLNKNREEQLIVSFETSLFIDEIQIYCNENPQSIVKFEMLDKIRKSWRLMWQRDSIKNKIGALDTVVKPILRRYRLKTDTIRITIDPRIASPVAIQSIKMIGSIAFNNSRNYQNIHHTMCELYEKTIRDESGDIKLFIDGKIIHAHQNILCCRTKYFRALLLNDFAERHSTKPIELTDVDFETFTEVLYFIYTGTYRMDISQETMIKCLIYSDKIDFLSGKNLASEQICRYLSADDRAILPLYCMAKKFSPAFDNLLGFIYNFCSDNMTKVFRRDDFTDLDKNLLLELVYQSAERHDKRNKHLGSNSNT